MDVSVSGTQAQAYVAHATATHEPVSSHTVHAAPANLPVAEVSHDMLFGEDEPVSGEEAQALNMLENRAHAQKVLLSSDAMRFLVAQVHARDEQMTVLDEVIKRARVSFPSEEGWVVLNLERMENLLDEVRTREHAPAEVVNTELENSVAYEPMTAGSLAEAIVTKNLQAAYEMIANRPMVALADAASDLDSVYRGRRGEQVTVSNLLSAYTRELSNDKLEALIAAITSAIDGSCPNEELAVKMAIMKAIKVLE